MKVRPRRHFTFAISGVGVLLYAVYRLWVGATNLIRSFDFLLLLNATEEVSSAFLLTFLTLFVLGAGLCTVAFLGISAFIRCRTGKKLIALAFLDGIFAILHMFLMYLLGGMFAANILFILLDVFFIVFGVMWGRYQAARRAEDPALPRRLFPFVREFGLYFTVDMPESAEK